MAREGIRELAPARLRAARAAGTPYRLVGRAERVGDSVMASVRPEQLAPGDPLAVADALTLVAHFETDILPGLTLPGHRVGPGATAYDLLADFVNVVRGGA